MLYATSDRVLHTSFTQQWDIMHARSRIMQDGRHTRPVRINTRPTNKELLDDLRRRYNDEVLTSQVTFVDGSVFSRPFVEFKPRMLLSKLEDGA
jgi:hypothetical protein